MYLNFFGLKEYPFSLTPDTQFFLNEHSHSDALRTLEMALEHGEGFIKVVGEVGTGKTLLCRILLSKLNKTQYVSAYIPNPMINPEELKAFLASEIAAGYERGMPAHELTSCIYRRLLQIARQGKKVVLVVDEAQTMPRETIEALRLLTNLETEKTKLLQVVILGQPELDQLLNRKDLRQLKQRIVFSEYLKPLNTAGVARYLKHRLHASGATSNTLFSGRAAWLIKLATGGIPRLINVLAHKSLMSAYGKGQDGVSGWHVARAIADTPECRWSGKLASCLWRWSPWPTHFHPAEVS